MTRKKVYCECEYYEGLKRHAITGNETIHQMLLHDLRCREIWAGFVAQQALSGAQIERGKELLYHTTDTGVLKIAPQQYRLTSSMQEGSRIFSSEDQAILGALRLVIKRGQARQGEDKRIDEAVVKILGS